MFSSSSYSPVPSTTGPENSISEEVAIRERGLKVLIYPPNAKTGKSFFSVEVVQGTSSDTFKKILLYSCIIIFLFSVASALVVRFVGVALINYQLDSPQANCTIVSLLPYYDAKGNLNYNVNITYNDTNGIEHVKGLSVDYADAQSYGWDNGTIFLCLYRGSSLWIYSDVHSEYSQTLQLWFLGFVIPFGFYLCWLVLYGPIYACTRASFMKNTKSYYFPRSISYRDDKDLQIVEWHNIPAAAHLYIYLFLKTYFEDQKPTTIAFSPANKKIVRCANIQRRMFIVYGFMLIGVGLGLGFGMGGFLFSERQFGSYLAAVAMGTIGFLMFGAGILALKLKLATENIAYSDSISFTYSLSENKLTGTFPA